MLNDQFREFFLSILLKKKAILSGLPFFDNGL